MEQQTKTKRVTTVQLNNEEFNTAIKEYLKSKGVIDTAQHVVIEVIATRDERGDELEITLSNYNKNNNIYK